MTAVLDDVARVRKEMYDAIRVHKQEVDPEDPNYGEGLAQIYALARREVAGMIRKVSNRHTQIKTLSHWSNQKWEAAKGVDRAAGQQEGTWFYDQGIDALKDMAKALHGASLETALDYLQNVLAEEFPLPDQCSPELYWCLLLQGWSNDAMLQLGHRRGIPTKDP